jgi:hypothetical protein
VRTGGTGPGAEGAEPAGAEGGAGAGHPAGGETRDEDRRDEHAERRGESAVDAPAGAPDAGAAARSSRGGGPSALAATIRIGVGAGRIVLFRYPPHRGTRRERLRREAEDARQAIVAGRPVRMTHVLELPPAPGTGDAPPEGSRRMSPAVGEVAKRFAPDLPIGRLVRPWPGTGPRKPAASGGSETRPHKSSPSGQGAAASNRNSQQIGAALADALASESRESANETPGTEARDANASVPPRSAPATAPRPRRHVAAAILAGAAVAASIVVALYVRGHRESLPAVAPSATQPDANAATSVVPAPPSTATQPPPPVEPPPAPAATRPPQPSGAGEYARAFATGESLLKQGRYRAAIAEYRKAVALRPESVPALIALGDAFLEADQPRNAVKPLLQAAQLDAGSARAQLLLGTAFQSLNRPKEAVAAYKRYLDLEPNGDFANDVRAIVANLSH